MLRAGIEIEGLVKDRKIMVSHEANLAPLRDQVQAFHGVGTISNDIAQADDLRNAAAVDLRQHRRQRLQVRMNIADYRKHRNVAAVSLHKKTLPRWESREMVRTSGASVKSAHPRGWT